MIMSGYTDLIDRDMTFLRVVLIPDLERQRNGAHTFEQRELQKQIDNAEIDLERLGSLRPVFATSISPMAACILQAIDKGLDLGSAREMVRPLAKMLEQIVDLEEGGIALRSEGVELDDRAERPWTDPKTQQDYRKRAEGDRSWAQHDRDLADKKRLEFSEALPRLADSVEAYLPHPPDDLPASSGGGYKGKMGSPCIMPGSTPEDPAVVSALPRYPDYRMLPHLFVAMSSLLLFIEDDERAVQVLKLGQGADFKDYNLPYYMGRIVYFQGNTADYYVPLFEQMRLRARSDEKLAQAAIARCSAPNCSAADQKVLASFVKRGRTAEIVAMNSVAYGIAQDLAAGIRAAEVVGGDCRGICQRHYAGDKIT